MITSVTCCLLGSEILVKIGLFHSRPHPHTPDSNSRRGSDIVSGSDSDSGNGGEACVSESVFVVRSVCNEQLLCLVLALYRYTDGPKVTALAVLVYYVGIMLLLCCY